MSDNPTIESLGGSGPDILLIHGYGGDRLSWLATGPALVDHGCVWIMDLPGHGQASREIGTGSLSEMAKRVLQTCDSVGLSQPHLLGHSLGGRIAMEIATLAPRRVKSLALLAPAGVGSSLNMDFLTRYHQARDLDTISELLSMLVFNSRMMSRSLSQVVLNNLEKMGSRKALELITLGLFQAQNDVDNTIQSLHEHSLPCMSLWGKDDRINPPDPARINKLPGEIHLLENCGHLPHIEHRIAVNKLLTSFYERQP